MKTSPQTKHGKASAFTLIEMIGVLAVIAILAALLVPKVFSAISDARVNSTCINVDTVKTAIADHYGKFGKLNTLSGGPDITGNIVNYDRTILMPEGLIDKVFSSKLAGGDPQTNSIIQLLQGTGTNTLGNAGGTPVGYKLDGSNTVNNASYLVEAVLLNVSQQDALDLHNRIDGQSLGTFAPGQACGVGRVEYAAGTPTTVYVYITHR